MFEFREPYRIRRVQSFGDKWAFRRIMSAPCRLEVRSSNEKSLLLLGLIANKFARRIHGFGQAGGGRGTGFEPSPRGPAWRKVTQRTPPISALSSRRLGPPIVSARSPATLFKFESRKHLSLRRPHTTTFHRSTGRKFPVCKIGCPSWIHIEPCAAPRGPIFSSF
jgi:hypothetical protein